MIYDLRHKTTYTYGAPVSFARCVLRLTPRSSAGQTVLSNSIAITPKPSSIIVRTGPFGELTQTVVVDQPHKALVIEARSRVDVHARLIDRDAPSEAWESVREQAFETDALGPDGPAAFLYPSVRAPIDPALTDYVRESFAPGRPIVQAAAGLMARMYADFAYDPEATEVDTPAAEAFAARRGVCQDFVHILLSGLRGLGLPAAYVSGYLRTLPPPGKPRLEGADATHAWISLWCGPDRGWIGIDPTNAVFAQNDHIVLAVGRDYADIAPIDGVILAPRGQTLKVEVDVIPAQDDSRLL
ncbi:MAG TPA: transglutaminase family protein [Caulobacteraceae bacterium]|nr:transglutaminase family protein [Caulobacteraceae bacterium]